MRKDSDDQLDPNRPALIVTYGNTTRKYRPLDRDVIVLGRAPGCDLGLASPEVAPVHCVLVHGADGWKIRDCSGRAGTRVNGTAIVEGLLKHGDTLQVGTFSFEAYGPTSSRELTAIPVPVATPAAEISRASISEIGLPVDPSSQMNADRRLDIRARELDCLAKHLQRRLQAIESSEKAKDSEMAQRDHEIGTLRARLDQTRQSA
ncbi:MAG: FHA domain-containing protein, partial [Candidatus Acidiferrum sp.]